jgi:hypothetical protein
MTYRVEKWDDGYPDKEAHNLAAEDANDRLAELESLATLRLEEIVRVRDSLCAEREAHAATKRELEEAKLAGGIVQTLRETAEAVLRVTSEEKAQPPAPSAPKELEALMWRYFESADGKGAFGRREATYVDPNAEVITGAINDNIDAAFALGDRIGYERGKREMSELWKENLEAIEFLAARVEGLRPHQGAVYVIREAGKQLEKLRSEAAPKDDGRRWGLFNQDGSAYINDELRLTRACAEEFAKERNRAANCVRPIEARPVEPKHEHEFALKWHDAASGNLKRMCKTCPAVQVARWEDAKGGEG